jgi:hypothetical protein
MLLHFVREWQYEEDIAVIEPDLAKRFILDIQVERECASMVRSDGLGAVQLVWSGTTLFIWYFELGASLYLLAMKSKALLNWQEAA